jgi:phage terminase small subunit
MKERRLTTKQKAFVENRLEGMNGVQAAREAGYKGSYNVLNAVAVENLQKPAIKAEIAKRTAEIERKTEYNIEKWKQDTLSDIEGAKGDKQWGAVAASRRLLGMNIGAFEADNDQKANKTLIAIRNEQAAIEAQIATGKALDAAPDALAL